MSCVNLVLCDILTLNSNKIINFISIIETARIEFCWQMNLRPGQTNTTSTYLCFLESIIETLSLMSLVQLYGSHNHTTQFNHSLILSLPCRWCRCRIGEWRLSCSPGLWHLFKKPKTHNSEITEYETVMFLSQRQGKDSLNHDHYRLETRNRR